jgi:hypothetical protein
MSADPELNPSFRWEVSIWLVVLRRTVCITNEFRGDAMLPSKDRLTICFAHVAYRLRDRFLTLATGIESFEVRDGAALEQRGQAKPTCWSSRASGAMISCRWKSGCASLVDRGRHRPVLAGAAQAARRAARGRPSPQPQSAVQHTRSVLPAVMFFGCTAAQYFSLTRRK